jgi:UDP-glucose 4-epimerase
VKVLIAGGAGFIGSTVASACLDAGITPVILDNLSTGRAEFAGDRIFYRGDIADGALVDRIFAEHSDITAVVHAAALIVVPESVEQPLRYYEENVGKSIDFIGHVLRNGVTRYLFSSSAAIYAPGGDFSVDENSPLDPGSPYARSKVMMEEILADTCAATALRGVSLRYFNPVGADPQLRTGPPATARASATSSTCGISPRRTCSRCSASTRSCRPGATRATRSSTSVRVRAPRSRSSWRPSSRRVG